MFSITRSSFDTASTAEIKHKKYLKTKQSGKHKDITEHYESLDDHSGTNFVPIRRGGRAMP